MQTDTKVIVGVAGGGLAAGAAYVIYRWLNPAGATGATPNPPTGLTLTPQAATSRTNAPILAKCDPYLGQGVPTYNWFHFYPKNGVLYPKLVGSTSTPEFLFGRQGASGVEYPVTPAKLYPVGVQVCVGIVCSTITRGSQVALAWSASSAQSASSSPVP